jgi:DNA polymerase I-like protein with 3'-5' exonuclease and polymerase domains
MKEAQHQFNKYWEVYSGVKELKDKIGKMVEDQTPIESPWGRLRHFPKALNDFELERFKRQGYNSLIQGTGADMTHYAYYKANQALQAEDLGRTLWQVHDEIVCEAPIGKEEFSKQMLVDIMRSASDEINFKYAVDAVPYGPFPCWRKT